MFLDAGALSPEASYRLSSGSVVPRPIAWITTVSADGVIHLAPFSCVTFVSNKPPLPGVNIGDAPQMRAIHDSSAGHASGVRETELLGLGTRPCRTVRVPRLADAPLSMECRLERVGAFGQTGAESIVGAVMVSPLHGRAAQLGGEGGPEPGGPSDPAGPTALVGALFATRSAAGQERAEPGQPPGAP